MKITDVRPVSYRAQLPAGYDEPTLYGGQSIAAYFEQLVPEDLFTLGGVEKIHIDKEGFAHVPEGPGVGAQIDWEMAEFYKVAEL